MSVIRNRSVRCDWCGKLSRSRNAEYVRPDGSAGYIVQPEWERFPGGRTDVGSIPSERDICEECAQHHCPACGSERIVDVTPGVPGPNGWGGRCEACGHIWAMPPMPGTMGDPPAGQTP